MYLGYIESRICERLQKRAEGEKINGDFRQAMLRELLIEYAPMIDPEELPRIFPDAISSRDYDAVKRMLDKHREKPPSTLLPFPYRQIAFYWRGFHLLGLAREVPPLEHWSDKAACEIVRFISGGARLELSNYQKCKSILGCHRENPTLISRAELTRDGGLHRLECWR